MREREQKTELETNVFHFPGVNSRYVSKWNVYVIKFSSCWPHRTWLMFCCQHHLDPFLLHAWSATRSLGNPLARVYNVPAYQCSSSAAALFLHGISGNNSTCRSCCTWWMILGAVIQSGAPRARQTINSINIWKDETVLQGVIAFSHLSTRSWEHCCSATRFSNLNQLQISC